MKKLIALVCALVMVFALVACGGDDKTPATPSTPSTPEPSPAPEPEPEPEPAPAGMKDGTYTANADSNIGGEVTVTITVSGGVITSCTVDVSSQTVGYGADHQADYEQDIVAKNGAKLDNVTGATMTSMAIQEAYEDCLKQAGYQG